MCRYDGQERLRAEHKTWGVYVPAVDIDCLVIEYDCSKPRAIIEYKHENVVKVDTNKSTIKALVNLGNAAGLPVFVAVYSDDFVTWWVKALNELGKVWLPEYRKMMRKEYITFNLSKGFKTDQFF